MRTSQSKVIMKHPRLFAIYGGINANWPKFDSKYLSYPIGNPSPSLSVWQLNF